LIRVMMELSFKGKYPVTTMAPLRDVRRALGPGAVDWRCDAGVDLARKKRAAHAGEELTRAPEHRRGAIPPFEHEQRLAVLEERQRKVDHIFRRLEHPQARLEEPLRFRLATL